VALKQPVPDGGEGSTPTIPIPAIRTPL
jgi:hypothetical protein